MRFDYLKDYALENERTKIFPLVSSHFNELKKISQDKFIWKYLLEKGDDSKSLKSYIETAIKNRKLKKQYPFVVYDKMFKEIAGTTSFYDYDANLNSIKLGHTWFGEKFRGTGLNKHCKYLLLEFAFEKINVKRIGFGVHSKNDVSNFALRSIGCKKEGVLRSFLPPLNELDERNDIYLWSILNHEWHRNVKNKLKKKIK